MRYKTLILLTLSLAAGIVGTAQADSKPWEFGWWPGHSQWTRMRDFNPYLEDGRHPHNTQWADREWYAEDWISQEKNGTALVRRFYETDILRGQKVENGIPVLVVGPNFYRLSGYDKRRVARVVDVVYGLTRLHREGTYIVRDWNTRKDVALYTPYGLQTQ